ncbi:Non-specific serine/threonine protein kinase [Handroanthus impetiginosus]|uniref:Non-specific serine/threonine protein kinase n=1 Tax=Handroanthus impetiginosus TaxID=429701 RepID=A0A2G9GVL9_9LAMI|nr:Non-specific serine/threonine protein kinase [Handroanthus impetiginosus]
MELKLGFFLVKFSLILCGFLLQESSGFRLPPLSLASVFLPINVKNPEFSLHGERQRYLLLQNDHAVSHTSARTHKGHGTFAAAPHLEAFHAQPPIYHPSTTPSDPDPRKVNIPSDAYAPSTHSTSSSSVSKHNHKHHHLGNKVHHIAPEPYHERPRASYSRKGPSISPSSEGRISTRPLPLPVFPSNHFHVPSASPTNSPMSSPMINNKKTLPPLPSVTFPPPPNQGCVSVKCTDPLTYTPPGAPCGCVWPIQVQLRFSISLYTFFPLVSDLAEEIAASIPLDRSQVRIMGADAADQQLDKTTVLINLVPLDEKFKSAIAFSIYTKFWKRELSIKTSVFGVYEVLYVRYPGLPPSPPSWPSGSATIDSQPYPGGRDDDGPIKPLGVDVPRKRKKDSDKNMVVIIVLSSVTAFVVCMGFVLLFLSKCGCCSCLYRQHQQALTSSDRKTSGVGQLLTLRSRPSSPSMSFGSSLLAFTGTAKVFTIDDIERATDNFNPSKTLGEGGFGRVYGGILDDGRKVAVKVLKRDDQHGSREFLAEVEMLSRLHHRNLVKLIGICAEEQCRCLVYELIPNGRVESHLHGADKDIAPLNW